MLPRNSIRKVYEYYFTSPRFSEEVNRAFMKFFNTNSIDNQDKVGMVKQSEGLFNEWFLYDFILNNGHTPIEDFVACNPFKLENSLMDLYKDLLDSKYAILEVLAIDLGKSIKVKDLQTDKELVLFEYNATFGLKVGSVFFGRVGKVGDHYELVGADTVSLADMAQADKNILRKKRLEFTPKILNDILVGKKKFLVSALLNQSKSDFIQLLLCMEHNLAKSAKIE